MTARPSFEIVARDGAARRGRLTTTHGVIETPAFQPGCQFTAAAAGFAGEGPALQVQIDQAVHVT